MATPQPTDGDVDRSMPHGEEAVLNLFETGAVMGSAGISDVAPRHLSRPGVPAWLPTHSAAARRSR